LVDPVRGQLGEVVEVEVEDAGQRGHREERRWS
jgi:hypothetical protein